MLQNKMMEIKELQAHSDNIDSTSSASIHIDDASICFQVFGKTAGYIFGFGPIPRKAYSSNFDKSSQYSNQINILMNQMNKKSNDINSLKELMKMQGSLLAKQTELLERPSMRLDQTEDSSLE